MSRRAEHTSAVIETVGAFPFGHSGRTVRLQIVEGPRRLQRARISIVEGDGRSIAFLDLSPATLPGLAELLPVAHSKLERSWAARLADVERGR